MTTQYKNQGFNLSTTGTTSVLTAPVSGRCLVKQIQAHNGSTGPVNLVTQVTDTSATATFRIDNACHYSKHNTSNYITNTCIRRR